MTRAGEVVIVDALVLVNLPNVPQRNDHREVVYCELEESAQAKASLLLPIATVLHRGNHIADLADGGNRRRYAKALCRQVHEARATRRRGSSYLRRKRRTWHAGWHAFPIARWKESVSATSRRRTSGNPNARSTRGCAYASGPSTDASRLGIGCRRASPGTSLAAVCAPGTGRCRSGRNPLTARRRPETGGPHPDPGGTLLQDCPEAHPDLQPSQ